MRIAIKLVVEVDAENWQRHYNDGEQQPRSELRADVVHYVASQLYNSPAQQSGAFRLADWK